MSWIDGELLLVSLAAMLSPLTLTWSVLALVLARQPLRTGLWFYLGALVATLGIGVLAAFVLGDAAASDRSSTPKTWVAVLDLVLGGLLIAWTVRMLRRPPNPEKQASMIEQMRKVASSPWIAIVAAGALLANPGVFIPIALKAISEEDPSSTQYLVDWVFFTLVSLIPLATAIVMLVVAREWAERVLNAARAWLERNSRRIAAVLVLLLAASLIRGGIAGLTG